MIFIFKYTFLTTLERKNYRLCIHRIKTCSLPKHRTLHDVDFASHRVRGQHVGSLFAP